MRLLLLTALTTVATASAAAPATTAKLSHPLKATAAENCQRTTSHHAVLRPGPRKLTELPPANMYAAVYRRIEGCEVPLVVRYNVEGRR